MYRSISVVTNEFHLRNTLAQTNVNHRLLFSLAAMVKARNFAPMLSVFMHDDQILKTGEYSKEHPRLYVNTRGVIATNSCDLVNIPSREVHAKIVMSLRLPTLVLNILNLTVPVSGRTDVANCTSCASASGCGYCLSTLQCLDGTSLGPSDGSPCPTWITSLDGCPGNSS